MPGKGGNKVTSWIRKEDGSLTLEAALVMPVFLLFTVFLATMIRISVADMALKQAVSETAEVVATHAYPAALAQEAASGAADRFIRTHTDEEFTLEEAQGLMGFVFDSFGIDMHGFIEQLIAGPVEEMVKAKFAESNPDTLFNEDGIQVEILEYPSSLTSGEQLFGIAATYELGIRAPFVDRTITLEQRAYERMWVGSR